MSIIIIYCTLKSIYRYRDIGIFLNTFFRSLITGV